MLKLFEWGNTNYMCKMIKECKIESIIVAIDS